MQKARHLPSVCKPAGVSVTGDGRVVISDVGNDRVHVFGRDGDLMKIFGGRGSRGRQFKSPHHVKVTRTDILVSDYDNHCVKVIRLLNLIYNGE